MSEYVWLCSACLSNDRGQHQVVEIKHDDGSREFVCPVCATVCGVVLNQGTLDLGIVRDSITQDHWDWEVFTEEPWRT